MIEELKRTLINEQLSLVVANRGELKRFTGRGIKDIYNLYKNDREFLRGAILADKVIGAGAAAVMIAGGVVEIFAGVISEKAQQLFIEHGVKVQYNILVKSIINRQRDGVCPLEAKCLGVYTVEEILNRVDEFVAELQQTNRATTD